MEQQNKEQQKKLLIEIMEEDQKNGLYDNHIGDTNKMVTAVESFAKELIDEGFYIPKGIYDRAKQMEKEQHDNWNKFLETEKTLGISDVKTIARLQWYYNQYFNQTYGK